MYSLNSATLAAQKSPSSTPFVQVNIGSLTYRSDDPNSGLRLVETVEGDLTYRGTIEVGPPTKFNPFEVSALTGKEVSIYWGFKNLQVIKSPPLRLLSVSTLSRPGESVTQFNCVGWWDLLAGSRVVRDPTSFSDAGVNEAATDTSLTDNGQNWLLGQWTGATVTCNGKTLRVTTNTARTLTGSAGWSGGGNPGSPFPYTVVRVESGAQDPPPVWDKTTTIRNILAELLQGRAGVRLDSSDAIIDSYKPYYEADGLESVLTTVRNLLDMTACYIKLRADGFHIVFPRGTDPTYTYRLDQHTFFRRDNSYKMIVPNRIVVVPQLPTSDEAPDFIGVDTDISSVNQLGYMDFFIVDEGISSQGEANLRAHVILVRLRLEGSAGTIIAPMNIGQELYDMVRVYDVRTAPALNIDKIVGRIRKTWIGGIKGQPGLYEIEIGLGGLTTHLSSIRTEFPIEGAAPWGPPIWGPTNLPAPSPIDMPVFGPPLPPGYTPPTPLPVSPWERPYSQPPPAITYPGGPFHPPVPDPIPYSPTPTPPAPTPTYRPPPTATPTPPPQPAPVSPWERRYFKSSQWSESSVRSLSPPPIDSVSGRSYDLAVQTPGSLRGRRGRIEWFIPGVINTANPAGQRVKVSGGAWRIVRLTARVTTAPSAGPLYLYVYYTVPGGAAVNILMPPRGFITINSGTREAIERPLRSGLSIPVGALIEMAYLSAGTLGEDLTVELDYIVRAIGQ